jgi:hypothetical protein
VPARSSPEQEVALALLHLDRLDHVEAVAVNQSMNGAPRLGARRPRKRTPSAVPSMTNAVAV